VYKKKKGGDDEKDLLEVRRGWELRATLFTTPYLSKRIERRSVFEKLSLFQTTHGKKGTATACH